MSGAIASRIVKIDGMRQTRGTWKISRRLRDRSWAVYRRTSAPNKLLTNVNVQSVGGMRLADCLSEQSLQLHTVS